MSTSDDTVITWLCLVLLVVVAGAVIGWVVQRAEQRYGRRRTGSTARSRR